ncbi:acyl-CoA mutase large subunit family protein [Blastococcus saxobsidens]|uniref:Methylmalonyl-CoA mutase, large subunit n=1 Tax=Blastococcus saxobsidens (strain DD2) TaxID=1146883 RepID=H6RNM1_BLASD|nr:acyl-CoA mutase large subunit family protein [Blastococcus saxobsidens]CCG05169.1 Methylmalonyl-CoA mutase, large subunit [Blastococcus saxobsidens DD2]
MTREGRQSANAEERYSTSGFQTRPFYASADVEGQWLAEETDFPPPGRFPYTRGFTSGGYRDELWAREMYAGFGSAEEANRRYRFLIENGATGGVSIALDLPTQIGYDSDDPMAVGEVGRIGVALDSYSDIDDLFSGVDLAGAGHVFSTANSIAPIVYSWVLTYCERHDIDPGSFRLQLQNDPIKEYVARGTHFLPIEAAVRLATDVVIHSHRTTPGWLPISVSGSHMKQAGSSPLQEAAFTLANGIAYLADAQNKGLSIPDFHPNLEFHFCTEMDFFEEVAKYRAVRQVWSRIATERFGVPEDRLRFRLHAATSGQPLTAQQPLNNISRITLQALAQILGGVEATRTASFDEALGIPTEEAAKTSLRINQIMAYETGIPDTTDPLGGSFYVETLTGQMAQGMVAELDKIEEMGGALGAVESGYYAQALAAGAYQQQVALDEGDRVIVGVNKYRSEEPRPYPRFTGDEQSEQRQCERLSRLRAARDADRCRKALEDLRDACAGTDNVMPAVHAAVGADCTVGEISGVWRAVFGEHHETRSVL